MDSKKKLIYISIIMIALFLIVKIGYDYLYKNYDINEISIDDNNEQIGNEGLTQNLGNKEAIDFEVYDEEGKKVKLSDYKGKKAVVVNFWASWCPPCKKEMPYFKDATEKYSNEDVEILMVNLTDGKRETKEKAMKYMTENGYDMQVLFDLDLDAVIKYGIQAVPRTLFINKDGKLVYDHTGIITGSILDENIEKLIK